MNIQNNMLCAIQIKPLKDEGTADITLVFKKISSQELALIKTELETILSQKNYQKREILEANNSLTLQVAYEAQEQCSKLLLNWASQTKKISFEKKQIFIAKLGGWFDF